MFRDEPHSSDEPKHLKLAVEPIVIRFHRPSKACRMLTLDGRWKRIRKSPEGRCTLPLLRTAYHHRGLRRAVWPVLLLLCCFSCSCCFSSSSIADAASRLSATSLRLDLNREPHRTR